MHDVAHYLGPARGFPGMQVMQSFEAHGRAELTWPMLRLSAPPARGWYRCRRSCMRVSVPEQGAGSGVQAL